MEENKVYIPDLLRKDRLLILLFHGVVSRHKYKIRNYIRKHIDRERFIEVISSLKKFGNPLTMDEVIEYHNARADYPPNSFVVTFDDGFANNYEIAAPILSDYEVPATFYITSKFIEENSMSWIDQVEILIEKRLNNPFFLKIRDERYYIHNVNTAIKFLDTLRNDVKSSKDLDGDTVVQSIADQLNLDVVKESFDELDRKMTSKELKDLSQNPLFLVGGHTYSHPNMAHLKKERLRYEIGRNLRALEDLLNHPIYHFAYPEGLQHSYSQVVIEALSSFGIRCCPTAIYGHNSSKTDLMHLKRVFVT